MSAGTALVDAAQARLEACASLPLPWDDPAFRAGAHRLLDFSDYAAEVMRRHAEAVGRRWAEGALATRKTPWIEVPDDLEGDDALRALRRARHLGQFEVLWRDVNGIATVDQTLADTTALADGILAAALRLAWRRLHRFGTPRGRQGLALDLIVFGLGKLGGGELNFSSDVDLVYAYREAGSTDGARSIDNEEYFRRLGTQLTRLLATVTEDGQCYRVDLRLRPFGTAGRVALSAAAMERYFEREGRNWERYAWIKARPVAGDLPGGRQILDALRPFVYRRYLDYGAFDSLREMKAMIRAEVERGDLHDHVKLGRGGIREIEFFVQAYQLIRGGREPTLRTRSLVAALGALEELGELEPERRRLLVESYRFLRQLENRFQQVADEQTHRPPADAGARDAIARSLGREGWDALQSAWDAHRDRVAACFESVFEVSTPSGAPADRWQIAWLAGDEAELPDDWREALGRLRAGSAVRMLSKRGRERLDQLMPRLLAVVDAQPPPVRGLALERVLEVIGAIASRSTYLAMMRENPALLGQLVSLCSRSRWITERLARHPVLLDQLIDRREADTTRTPALHLARRLPSAEGDLELEMEILREVQDSRALDLAVDLLDGAVDPGQVSSALAATVDAVLEAVYELAWRDLTARHGVPPGEHPGLAIIGYGTLGGRELSFGSDLDLVFLHGSADLSAATDGERPVDAARFFTRLSQRILHLLTTQTASGRLYEVDTRLRPNGRSGLLVSGLRAFADYQRDRAWTWELQALIRARWVAGEASLAEPFEAIRREVLCRPRDVHRLRAEVLDMREKMRGELDRSSAEHFDLKQGPGGRVDLEYAVHFGILRWAAGHPLLVKARSTAECLAALTASGHLDQNASDALLAAEEEFRRAAMEAALDHRPALMPAGTLADARAVVRGLWSDWLAAD